MESVKTTIIPLNKLERNSGQIEGLPKNPRIIRDEKYNLLKKSIEDNPEMLALRELLVYPLADSGKYIVIGGNMRLAALKDLKYKEAPCKVIPATATVEQLQAYTIKDNSGFGEWDFDALANEWNAQDLANWGIDAANWDTDTQEDNPPTDEDDEVIDGREEGEEYLVELAFTLRVSEYNKVVEILKQIADNKNAALVEILTSNRKA